MKDNLTTKIQRVLVPMIFNGDDPVGFVFFNQNHDRVMYTAKKADEEEIISLIETKE